ncbi:MAG: hypothetical protein WAK29_08455, partial [Terriglobales bacterium]
MASQEKCSIGATTASRRFSTVLASLLITGLALAASRASLAQQAQQETLPEPTRLAADHHTDAHIAE